MGGFPSLKQLHFLWFTDSLWAVQGLLFGFSCTSELAILPTHHLGRCSKISPLVTESSESQDVCPTGFSFPKVSAFITESKLGKKAPPPGILSLLEGIISLWPGSLAGYLSWLWHIYEKQNPLGKKNLEEHMPWESEDCTTEGDHLTLNIIWEASRYSTCWDGLQ